MPRIVDPAMQVALESGVIVPAFLVMLTFKSGVRHVWSGIGPLVYDAQTYIGVGSLGQIGAISEGVDIRADGTSVSLSGIDPTLYAESMADMKLGAPAKIWFALLNQGVIIGSPYLLFSGLMDKPSTSTGSDAITITIALENRMTNLQRPSQRRYTSADQRTTHPDDTSFFHVERLSDDALVWGSS